MAKFTFQLQPVLRHREMIEQQRQRDFALVSAEHAALTAQLKMLDETVQNSLADLRKNRLIGTLDLNFLAAHRRFTLAVQRQAIALMQRIDQAKQKLDAAQAALREAVKQRKILEKLREKQLERFRAQQDRRELAQLDEVSMQLAREMEALP